MSEARRLGELLPGILLKARRLAILGQLIETFPDPAERKSVILRLYELGVISAASAELLIESYHLEAA